MGSAVRNLYQALKNVSNIRQLLVPINTTIDPGRFLTGRSPASSPACEFRLLGKSQNHLTHGVNLRREIR